MESNHSTVKDFKASKYFQYLKSHSDEIENELEVFNKEFTSILKRGTDELGTVLKCHLIIEYYIDRYFAAAYPTITKIDLVKLSFYQKLELCYNRRTGISFYYDGIKCLNKLRNKFGHDLFYKLEKKDCIAIERTIKIWNDALGKPIPGGLDMIQQFTMYACAALNGYVVGIRKKNREDGLPGYLKWLSNMQKKNDVRNAK